MICSINFSRNGPGGTRDSNWAIFKSALTCLCLEDNLGVGGGAKDDEDTDCFWGLN